MAAFAATLLRGPAELRGMRHSLTSWLELTDATADVRDAVLLATHEAAANAMTHGEPESPVSIAASQGEDGSFPVDGGNYGGWKEPEGWPPRGRSQDGERAYVRGHGSTQDER